jgi:hypothetical protein
VEVDIEQRLLVVQLADDMWVPQSIEEGAQSLVPSP